MDDSYTTTCYIIYHFRHLISRAATGKSGNSVLYSLSVTRIYLKVTMMTDFEIWPGPMEGIGKREFVYTASKLQLTQRWMTPFIRITESIPSTGKLFQPINAYLETGLPVTVQLMGNDPVLLGKCSKLLLKNPAVAGINLNFGCPSTRVVKHGSGGGLLKNPEHIADFFRIIADFIPPEKLSIKMRTGFSSSNDMEIFLPQLAEINAVSKIFLHYRTVTELYNTTSLPCREERFARAMKLAGNIPLILNGDISSVTEGKKIAEQNNAAGIMIARPWMRDPFLLRRFYSDAPDPETGRELFFATLKEAGVAGGALIELAKMLWGSNSAHFREVITACNA